MPSFLEKLGFFLFYHAQCTAFDKADLNIGLSLVALTINHQITGSKLPAEKWPTLTQSAENQVKFRWPILGVV